MKHADIYKRIVKNFNNYKNKREEALSIVDSLGDITFKEGHSYELDILKDLAWSFIEVPSYSMNSFEFKKGTVLLFTQK